MKKPLVFIMITALIFSMAGCKSPARNTDRGEPEKPGDTIVEPSPDGETVSLNLYFANNEYVQTGNENLDKLLVEKRDVTVTDRPSAEVAVAELMKGPKGDKMSGVIPSKLKLLSAEVADGIAYVNFSSSNMNGGSMEEFFLISSVIMTLTDLDGIRSVQFLVDGKKPETLMGHAYTMEPMGRSDM